MPRNIAEEAPRSTAVRRRRWDAVAKTWRPWSWCELSSSGKPKEKGACLELELHRGGKIEVFRNFVDAAEREGVVENLDKCAMFRQYKLGNVPEPRLHMLLADGEPERKRTYRYHGVTMVAQALASVPRIEALAREASSTFDGLVWNVGVDVVCYRDGQDSCGWHADDTQGETLVMCVVLQSDGGLRKVCFRPKQEATSTRRAAKASPRKKRRSSAHSGEAPLADGDEELELWIGAGDAYSMDRGVQVGYEHAVPKRPAREPSIGRRIVAIMRSGRTESAATFDADSGEPTSSLEAPARRDLMAEPIVGHVPGVLEAVGRCGEKGGVALDEAATYSREYLVETRAHVSAQRGVAGLAARGAESIVVSRQSPNLREADGLVWLRYTSTRRQGAGALWRSLGRRSPVRVFRSSALDQPWAPKLRQSPSTGAVYRYDGLYEVVAMWDDAGAPSELEPSGPDASGEEPAFTFRLLRIDGHPNACGNADFVRLFSSRSPPPPAVDDASGGALPPMSAAARGVSSIDNSPDLLDRRTAAAKTLAEMVTMVVARSSGWFDPDRAPQLRGPLRRKRRRRLLDDEPEVRPFELEQAKLFAQWHAHRRLFWRFHRLARGRRERQVVVRLSQPTVDLSEALGASSDESLWSMLAAAKSRSIERAVAAVERDEADELLAADDARLAGRRSRCDLCGEDWSTDELLFAISGTFVVGVHRHCAETSSEVYTDGGGRLVNVVRAVKRGRFIKCALEGKCAHKKKSGATVGCGNARCRRSYHFKCAISTGWRFGPNLTFWCDAHREGVNYDPDDDDEDDPDHVDQRDDTWLFDCPACGVVQLNYDDGQDMWQCFQCESWQHARCATRELAAGLAWSESAAAPVTDQEDGSFRPDKYRCSRCSIRAGRLSDETGVDRVP